MSVISISRGSFSQGKLVAEKLAEKLGYDCVSREILHAASDTLKVPETKLIKAVSDAPSIVDRFSKEKERFIRTIRSALLNYVKKDNIVYHGVFGQFFLKDIAHVLKARIQMDFESRVAVLMEQEKMDGMQARLEVKKRDETVKKWGHFLYNTDPQHPTLYDLVLNVGNMTTDDIVDLVAYTIQLDRFKTSRESREKLNDLSLAADIFSAILELPATDVTSTKGHVVVQLKAPLNQSDRLHKEVRDLTRRIEGIENLELVFS